MSLEKSLPVRPAYFEPTHLEGYELVDSGAGWKLERFGSRLISRPDPQALWERGLSLDEWRVCDLRFDRDEERGGHAPVGIPKGKGGKWRGRDRSDWQLDDGPFTFVLKPTRFKHVGLFPEQATNWRFIEQMGHRLGVGEGSQRPKLLNLFGYTGAASLVASRAGFEVTHVDASRTTIGWVKENLAASGMSPDSFRLILDDAFGFARRESRRGHKYAGIILDPPHYGRGPKGEKWQLEEQLSGLLTEAAGLLAERSFCVLSAYAVGYSPLAFMNMFQELAPKSAEITIEAGELVVPERSGRLLPCGFCARWRRGL